MLPPIVSYVIAAHNHETFIEELLQSALDQTLPDIEVIVIDDGSTDKTLKVARRVAQTDPRVAVYSQANSGVVAARNAGMKRSSAPYISVVDSDELLPRDRTEKMARALDANPAASLVYGDAMVMRPEEGGSFRFFETYPPVPGPFSEALFCNYCFVPAGSVMFRRAAWERTGPFWGPGPNSDYLKWIELGMLGEAICLEDEVLGTWRLHGENVSQVDAVIRCQQYDALCQALVVLMGKYPEFARQIGRARQNHRYSRCYVMAGFYAGREHLWLLAQAQFALALSHERSLINLASWLSTFPGLRYPGKIACDWAAKRFLRRFA
jgi:glycosyltransferase involved in cell wall biosynthesis